MMVDFKFDGLHREPAEVGLVEKAKFVLVGGAGCAIPNTLSD